MKIRKWKIAITAVAVIIVFMAVGVFFSLPKPVASSDSAYDLTQLADGTYTGSCDNGMVKVQVAVEVRDHSIADVRITEHDNGRGAPAEAITGEVIRQQSVEVDAVSGATFSSKTILKAIENALSEMGE
ncbi:FMN-binding protein [Ruminococcaceae bacterium OttesenSCG-928-L11]|nr:FMN-binding protein [Ruminococcaceae bacterium OttesenSCG-928-L11]